LLKLKSKDGKLRQGVLHPTVWEDAVSFAEEISFRVIEEGVDNGVVAARPRHAINRNRRLTQRAARCKFWYYSSLR
jgi:hypothetical protein